MIKYLKESNSEGRLLNMESRLLTKSRFKLAMECPGKLNYTGKNDYANKQIENSFLQALAEGGFQVGELAKLYYPNGHEIKTLDYERAVEETNQLLNKEKCVIYEAALKYQDMFVRVDILVKNGSKIDIIEVKSKSVKIDSELPDVKKEKIFLTKKEEINKVWEPYLYDIAFQKYVATQSLAKFDVSANLVLVNKASICPTDGLNQKFKIVKDKSERKYAIVSDQLTEEDLAEKLLVKINMDNLCNKIYEASYSDEELSFIDIVKKYAYLYKNDIMEYPEISIACKNCEFKASEEDLQAGLKSGYHECFNKQLNWTDRDFNEATIFDLWDNRNTRRQIENGLIKLSQLELKDIEPATNRNMKSEEKNGLSKIDRQWLQIEKNRNNDMSAYVDKEGLRKEIETWEFPYHFIDFETAMPAIPYNRGRKPYEGIAFQFSHHIVYKDGTIEHKGQYLNTNPGEFPNYEFLRQLKSQLDRDRGSIFRYATHENTYLNLIYEQLASEREQVRDSEELLKFIIDITQPSSSNITSSAQEMFRPNIVGNRNMIDMLEVVKKYYYSPYMKGSNSIKVVLPSILKDSTYIREKFSKPIYGIDKEIKSLNFPEKIWVEYKDGAIRDPYELLPNIFEDLDYVNYDLIDREDRISDGGAAMTAYERLQFEKIPDNIREKMEVGLLKYCELDTLAMVMIYEAWKNMLD